MVRFIESVNAESGNRVLIAPDAIGKMEQQPVPMYYSIKTTHRTQIELKQGFIVTIQGSVDEIMHAIKQVLNPLLTEPVVWKVMAKTVETDREGNLKSA